MTGQNPPTEGANRMVQNAAEAMLDVHYLAEAAVLKLEKRTKL